MWVLFPALHCRHPSCIGNHLVSHLGKLLTKWVDVQKQPLVYNLNSINPLLYYKLSCWQSGLKIILLFPLSLSFCRIQQLFMEFLSNSRKLRWLSCDFMLGLVTPCSLACVSNQSAESLQHLSLLDHQLGTHQNTGLSIKFQNCTGVSRPTWYFV